MVKNVIVSKEDINWLASAIDGEGSICINNKTGLVQVVVYNKNYEYAKKAADLMGCKVYQLRSGIYSAYTNRKMTVLKILKQVEPHLVIKRKKAIAGIRIILDYYDIADISLRAYPSLP